MNASFNLFNWRGIRSFNPLGLFLSSYPHAFSIEHHRIFKI
jgi:hypothetical protein